MDTLLTFATSDKDENRHDVQPVDRERSQSLRAYLRAQKQTPSAARSAWDPQFAILRRRYGSDEVGRVLDAYIRHRIDKPRVASAEQFKMRWDWIVQVVDRLCADEFVYSDDAKAIVADLSELIWPGESHLQLPRVVQKSLDNYQLFADLTQRFSPTPQYRGISLRDVLLEVQGRLADPHSEVLSWFRAIWKAVKGWAEWSGKLDSYVWNPLSDRFGKWAARVVSNYCGEPDAWSQVVAVLKEELSGA